jgi:hypothetical protein
MLRLEPETGDKMKYFTESEADRVIVALDYLDILDRDVPLGKGTAFHSMVDLFINKLSYGPDEEDLVIMENSLIIEKEDHSTYTIKISM